ncbi:MAG TPA: MFS transporter, partial [Aminobacterium sp.]|nr:MFS transporter [Aminobacterium sp.]
MFKEMRRKDRELSNKEALALLELGNYMVFSTLSQDGYSYGVPLHYVFINNTIYFHCAMEGHKLENVAH